MKILIKDAQMNVSLNSKILYDEIDNEGYFFDEELDRIIVMNSTCLFLWNIIKNSVCDVISLEDITALYKKHFILDEENLQSLNYDILKTINDMIELRILINYE
jgi:hypothetical protein